MKRLLALSLGLALVSTGLQAQTITVKALKDMKACATATKTPKCKVFKAGAVTRPVFLAAQDRSFFPPAFATASLTLIPKKVVKFKPGSELADKVKCMGASSAGAAAPAIQWTYLPGKKVQGVIRVSLTGVIFGQGKVDAYVKFNGKEYGKKIQKAGPFRYFFTIPVAATEKVSLTYGIREAGLKSASNMSRGSLECRLGFYFEAKAVTPGLAWVNPKQAPNCGKGLLGKDGDVAFGKSFKVTLKGATDTGKVRMPYALLLIGNSDKRFYFLNLPLDLSSFGAKGCTLYTNIVATRFARIDKNGDAAVPVVIPGHGYWIRYFRPLYFQYAYSTTDNAMGFKFTNYAAVVKK